MKKMLYILPLFAVAFALTIAPAFAKMSKSGTGNSATTTTVVKSNANSGGNLIANNTASTTTKGGLFDFLKPQTCSTCGTNTISTGAANSTVAHVNSDVDVSGGGSGLFGMFGGSSSNKATTKTVVISNANSGDNQIVNNTGGTNSITTGSATSGVSYVSSDVTVK